MAAKRPDTIDLQNLILDATLSILEDVGPERLQVREVVVRSQTSLATVYRYFPTKDYLIAQAMGRWTSGLRGRLVLVTRQDGNPGDRLAAILRLTQQAFEPHPNYSRAILHVMLSTDPLTDVAARELRMSSTSAILLALADLEPELAADIEVMVYALLNDQLIAWSTGYRLAGFRTSGAPSQLERGIRVIQAAISANSLATRR
jgi:TetR/AcrR family transcriptional regulator, cholesterol catabolism regulator